MKLYLDSQRSRVGNDLLLIDLKKSSRLNLELSPRLRNIEIVYSVDSFSVCIKTLDIFEDSLRGFVPRGRKEDVSERLLLACLANHTIE